MPTCNGQQIKNMLHAGLHWLEKHQQIVNALNVFPVPDGDTGTNMLLTMRSAWKAIQADSSEHAGELLQRFAKGALMGARGNSGVILSQIWRGMAKSLQEHDSFDGVAFGSAFQMASDTAYGGVMKPVEGTILTVVREAAEEAQDAAGKGGDVIFVLRRALTRCRQALERTPDQLPILKQAGVVDSGGQGLVYILEGMHMLATGKLAVDDIAAANNAGVMAAANMPAQAHAAPDGGVLENHYDVQFILIGENLNVVEVRNTIDAMGDSTVVVGDETTIKVHVHVDNPGEPISYGISLGEITDVVVENMQMQMDDIIATGQVHADASAAPIGVAAHAQLMAEAPTAVEVEPGQIGVVAVAAGDGLANIFRTMGVAEIVEGGQTNNPSTEELYAAIQKLNTDKIILLPNNKNIILACEAARDLAAESDGKQVFVVPTRTAPQGFSAMLGLNADGELEEVAEAMQELADEVVTAQLTMATRTVEINGVAVDEGNIIGLIDGKLCTSGDSIATVLPAVLAQIEDIDDRELVALFYGSDVSAAEAAAVAEQIENLFPDLEVEVQAGGQAHYYYIMGLE